VSFGTREVKALVSGGSAERRRSRPAEEGGFLPKTAARMSSKLFWMAWNRPRISLEDSGELSAGKLGSRIGVDISNLWFVFQAGLKVGFCPPLTSSGPVCPGIARLLAHCLAARPLPSAYGLGDRAKPPENMQNLPGAALRQVWQDGAGMIESKKQFSFTRAASSTSGRARSKFLSV